MLSALHSYPHDARSSHTMQNVSLATYLPVEIRKLEEWRNTAGSKQLSEI